MGGHVCVRDRRDVYRGLAEKPEEKRPLGRPSHSCIFRTWDGGND